MSQKAFQRIHNMLLIDILKGEAVLPDDPIDAAAKELRDRKRDHNGAWVGKDAADKIYTNWLRKYIPPSQRGPRK